MGQKIWSCCISLLLTATCVSVSAQNVEIAVPPLVEEAKQPLLNGLDIGVDLYGIGSKLLGGDFLSAEVNLEANLKNRFFPIVEIGYGRTDAYAEQGIHYKGSAPYARVGMNYNFQYKKDNKVGYWFLGVRYGISAPSYDVSTPPVEDPIWNSALSNPNLEDPIWGGNIPYDYPGQSASVSWYELLGGVRVRITEHICMGWTLRMKWRLGASVSEYGDPWFVPGYGTYKSSQTGITYTISYYLPIRKR
jgi:hypothetical protein